jgi:hypothetical protein
MNFIIGNEYEVEFNSEWKDSVYQGIWQSLFESDKSLAYVFVVTEYHRIHGSYQFSIHVKAGEVDARVRQMSVDNDLQSSTLTLPPDSVSIE